MCKETFFGVTGARCLWTLFSYGRVSPVHVARGRQHRSPGSSRLIPDKEQQLAKTAAFQKRMNQTDQECSHLNNHAYIACYFKGLGVISRSGVYVVSAGAQLLAAECDRLRPKEVEGIAKDCNSVNDEPDLSSARRAELLLLCVAHKVDPDVCNIPIPSYNGKDATID